MNDLSGLIYTCLPLKRLEALQQNSSLTLEAFGNIYQYPEGGLYSNLHS